MKTATRLGVGLAVESRSSWTRRFGLRIAVLTTVRLVAFLLFLCAAAPAQQRIEETFFLSAPNFFTGIPLQPIVHPVSTGAAADGSVVLLGRASGAGLPVFNAAQPDWASASCLSQIGPFACPDFYLARFLPDGQGPAYMTYLGSPNEELPLDLAVGTDGTAYILGSGALDLMPATADLSEPELIPDGSDPFLLTVSPSGEPQGFVRLPRTPSYSSLALDASGAAYLAGTVHSGVESISGFGNEGPEISLYISSDGGDVWTAQPTAAPPLVSKLVAVQSNGATQLFANSTEGGVFVSDDQGHSWRLFAPRIEPPSHFTTPAPDFAVSAGKNPTVFTRSGSQIYRSSGGPFKPLFEGLSVAVFESDPLLIRVTTLESLVTSRDGGETWESLPFPADFGGDHSSLWLHPTRPEVVYMQAFDAADFQRILVASEDGGSNWRRIDEPLRELIPSDFLFSFEVLDFEISSIETLFAATTAGLFISNNGGLFWTASNEGFPMTGGTLTLVLEIEIDAFDPLRLTLAVREASTGGPQAKVFLLASTDGGQSWRPAAQPPVAFNGTIAADPLQAGVFHALGGFRHYNAFGMKLPPSLDRIEYFSIYGGSERDEGLDIAIDSSGRAYLAGWTLSVDLPATDGGFQENLSGPTSAFIARFSADGSRVERATYLGRSDPGSGSVALDPQGFVYITGSTRSKFFPLVNPARTRDSPRPQGQEVGFLTKLDPDLGEIVYSTLLGARDTFRLKQRLAADALGRAHLLRQTGPVDADADGGLFFGGSKLLAVERFSAEGVPEDVLYFDRAAAIALDADDQLVVVGNGTDGLVPARAVPLPRDSGEANLRPPLHAAYLARAAPNPPALYVEAVLNAASFRSGPASPGELVSLFGRDLGPEAGAVFELVDGRLPDELGGTQVLFGATPAPLLFSGAGQVNAATPFSLDLGGLVPIRVRRNGAESNLIWQTIGPLIRASSP